MKGYVANKILYIFPQTPAEIPYVDPSVEAIAVQEENINAWKEENTSYADIIVKYNYNIMTVKPKVWACHTDDDITAPYHTITLGSHAGDYVSVDKETAETLETVTITPNPGYTTTNVNVATNPIVELTIVEGTWIFKMPDSDITVLSSLDNHIITYPEGYEEMFEGPNVGIDGEEIVIYPSEELLPAFNQIRLMADNDIYVNKDYANKRWTFTMVDYPVTLSAQLLQYYRLYLNNRTASSFTIYDETTGANISSGDYVTETDNLVVSIVDTTTYSFDPTDTGKTILYPYNVDGSYHTAEYVAFPMPNKSATLVIDNLSTCLYTVSGTEASNVNLLVNDQQINSGDFVYPREHCKLTPDTGYTFNTQSTSGDTILSATFTGVTANYDSEGDCYYFDMVNGDVNAEVKEYTSYSITYGGNTILLDNHPASAYPGDKVVLYPADDVGDFETTLVYSNDVVINKYTSDNIWYFNMPASDVLIEVLRTYTTTLANGGDVPNWNILKSVLTITNNPEKAGETVTLNYSSSISASQVAAITWIPSDGTTVINQADPTVPTWTWTQPATDLTLTGYVTPPA